MAKKRQASTSTELVLVQNCIVPGVGHLAAGETLVVENVAPDTLAWLKQNRIVKTADALVAEAETKPAGKPAATDKPTDSKGAE